MHQNIERSYNKANPMNRAEFEHQVNRLSTALDSLDPQLRLLVLRQVPYRKRQVFLHKANVYRLSTTTLLQLSTILPAIKESMQQDVTFASEFTRIINLFWTQTPSAKRRAALLYSAFTIPPQELEYFTQAAPHLRDLLSYETRRRLDILLDISHIARARTRIAPLLATISVLLTLAISAFMLHPPLPIVLAIVTILCCLALLILSHSNTI
jgi:hypothetical protein